MELTQTQKHFAKTVIKNWFSQHREEKNWTDGEVNEILDDLTKDIHYLEQAPMRIFIQEYLREHYDLEIHNLIIEVLDELRENSERVREAVEDWLNLGFYDMEIGCLRENVVRMELFDKYSIISEEDLVYDVDKVKEEIKKFIVEYINECW